MIVKKVPAENGVADGAPLILVNDAFDEDGDDGDDLGNGFVFAVTFGGEDYVFRGGEQAEAGDGQFARYHDDSHPGGEPAEFHESDEGGADHDFVREGVHEDAEIGDEVAAPGDQ